MPTSFKKSFYIEVTIESHYSFKKNTEIPYTLSRFFQWYLLHNKSTISRLETEDWYTPLTCLKFYMHLSVHVCVYANFNIESTPLWCRDMAFATLTKWSSFASVIVTWYYTPPNVIKHRIPRHLKVTGSSMKYNHVEAKHV